MQEGGGSVCVRDDGEQQLRPTSSSVTRYRDGRLVRADNTRGFRFSKSGWVEGGNESRWAIWKLLIEEWTNGVMNVNAIFDRAPETWGGSINQSVVTINHQSIKMKRKEKEKKGKFFRRYRLTTLTKSWKVMAVVRLVGRSSW